MRQIARWKYPQLREGLVGAWCPSQGATGHRLLDRSGYNNHGTLTNMDPATDWVASGDGLALDFDNSNDYVTCGSIVQITNVFSLSFWYQRTSSTPESWVIGNGNYPGNSYILYFQNASNVIRYIQNNDVISTGITLSLNQWYHICATRTGTSGAWTVKHYANGIEGNSIDRTINPGSGTYDFRFGVDGKPANGLIDDVNVYRRALSPSEITILAQRRGILYETMPTRYHMRGPTGGGGGFKPYWANRRSQLIGGGT